jgi:hypothetical protein
MELRDFFEDDELSILKIEFRKGDRRHEFSKWIHDQCRHHETYQSGEFTKDGIDLNYVSTDEELWNKWLALESGKRVFFLKGEMRRIGILKKAKLEAERQSSHPTSP